MRGEDGKRGCEERLLGLVGRGVREEERKKVRGEGLGGEGERRRVGEESKRRMVGGEGKRRLWEERIGRVGVRYGRRRVESV